MTATSPSPILDCQGRVLHAPNPRYLISGATPDDRTDPWPGVLDIGGSWRPYASDTWYDLVVTVCGTREGSPAPYCDREIAWPLHDDGTVNEPVVRLLTAEVAAAVRDGQYVLVRCYTGQNRSGLIVASALRDLYGMSGEEAVTHLRAVRSPNVLCNPAFERYVLALDET